MGTSIRIQEIWGWKITIESVMEQTKRFNKLSGEPYFKDIEVGKKMSINNKEICQEKNFYDGETYLGLELMDFSEYNLSFLGRKIKESDDIMYGTDCFESTDQPPEELIKFAKEHKLEDPKHFIVGYAY